MASLTTFRGIDFWYAMIRDAEGRQHCYTTGIEHSPPGSTPKQRSYLKQEAQIIAIELERAERGAKCTRVLRKRYGIVAGRMRGAAGAIQGIEAYLRAWARQKATTGISNSRRTTINQVITEFIEACGDARARQPMYDVMSADIQTYRERLQSRTLEKSTQNAYVHVLQEAFNDAEIQGAVFLTPVDVDRHFYEDEDGFTHKPLLRDAVNQLLATTKPLQWRCAIYNGYYFAMRFGDATTQRWRNINWDRQEITWVPSKTKRSHPGPVTLPIHDHYFRFLKTLPRGDDDDYITPQLAKYKPSSRCRIFMAMLNDAGIDPEYLISSSNKPFPQISFSSLRHGCATALDAAGVTKERNKLITAHETDAAHNVYVHQTLLLLKADIALLSPVD